MNHRQLLVSENYKLLNTSKQGLHSAEVVERQKQYGKNELTEKKKISVFVLFLNQFKDVMIFILLLAAVISFSVGHIKDAVVILIIVLLNTIIGFVQEYRAEKAMEALKKMAAFNATVRRGGNSIQVSAAELVPGDIIILEAGFQFPQTFALPKRIP